MRLVPTACGAALLVALSTFVTTSNAAPTVVTNDAPTKVSNDAPTKVKVNFKRGKNFPDRFEWGSKEDNAYPFPSNDIIPKGQVCYPCELEVDACVKAAMSGWFNPDLDGMDYQRNCECQQVENNRFCRVKCGRSCYQIDYEGPY